MDNIKHDNNKLTIEREIAKQLEIEAKYSIFLEKQEKDIQRFKKDENLLLPSNLDYHKLNFLSNEEKEKLTLLKPSTLGSASRISG